MSDRPHTRQLTDAEVAYLRSRVQGCRDLQVGDADGITELWWPWLRTVLLLVVVGVSIALAEWLAAVIAGVAALAFDELDQRGRR